MPPDLPTLILAAGDEGGRDVAARMTEALPRLAAWLTIDVLAGATIAGLALAVLLFAPERHRAACGRLARSPLASLLLGFIVLALTAGIASRLAVGRGRGAMLAVLAYAAAGGLSVAARFLGARLLPDGGPSSQTGLGLAALLLPCALLVGVPVAVVAAAIGLGAWLTARRR